MQAALIDRYGDNSRVRLADVPVPAVGHEDLLVKVHAASVNPVDTKIRDGKLKVLIRYRMPLVLGNDLAGTVTAIGPGVTRFKVGDAIYARMDKQRIGAFAEYALVREAVAAPKPVNLTFEEAASLPLVGLTAWQALIDIGRLQAGQKVLIHAGSGGVGTFAIQLARHLGAKVYTTVGQRNVELVQQLGADVAIDYRTTRFEDVVQDCDVVLETLGDELLLRSFRSVKPGGVVVSIGNTPTAAFAREWGLNPLLVFVIGLMSRKAMAAARARGARYEYLFMRADGEQLRQIAALVESGTIKPVIDRVFPLQEVREALAYSESGRATGKVVIRVD
ncbi:MAG: NADP-dependent oxidoreductase [Gammaproteobacteria bacterium]|nr:NADP-dependent oxidoreductase [Gammaproteobacteria bacterium]MDH5227621.1 NADP-dependent oxidoreductase [Gammaproteobacteria bacterium]